MQIDWVTVIDNQATMVIEAPCGLIQAKGEIIDGQIQASFDCVPSFVTAIDQSVYVHSLKREIQYDLAYGGAFYAYVDASQIGLELIGKNHQKLAALGDEIKRAVIASSDAITHPFEADLSFLYGTIFVEAPLVHQVNDESNEDKLLESRNVCIFADGEVDRSPTGSGVSGRMALHHQKQEMTLGQSMKIQSIIGSAFIGKVTQLIDYGPHQAVIPTITGNADVCGNNEFIIQTGDPLKHGFLLR